MTDYQEEQRNEIEALESIYSDELTIVAEEPYHSFQLQLSSSCEDEDAENGTYTLQFTYTDKYPDEAPVMEVIPEENTNDQHVEELQTLMTETAEENLGMVMVFTIYSAAQEKLDELVQQLAEETRTTRERELEEHEEAERKKFEGVRVTVETFLAWKAKFDAEIEEAKRLKGQLKKKDPTKLTGKEMFLQNHALDDSDVKFLEEEGEKVEVDESLFQDMDDLDLDDEDFDLDAAEGS